MTPAEIRAAIAADPQLQALAQQGATQAIADALSVGRTKLVSSTITTRGASALYPDLTGLGRALSFEVAMMAMEQWRDANIASSTAAFKLLARAIKRQLEAFDARGLDFSDAELRGMLDRLAVPPFNVLTQAQADGFKGLCATAPDPITHTQVGHALAGGN